MSKFKALGVAATASISLIATPASAAELLYSFSSTGGTYDFSFTLDSNPTPDDSLAGADFFIFNYPVTTPAGAETSPSLRFRNSSFLGGLSFGTPTILFDLFVGPQLYSGPEASPTMLTGEFFLTGNAFPVGGFTPVSGTLSVTEVNAAVPEPDTWAMMLLGFGAMGWSFKRCRKFALA